jgi:flavin-dependent dehydrogenase
MNPRPITIIGGGLAGLTLGIALRKKDIPVTIWEAGNYPRHRVCGEFISGHGQAVLEQLGLREHLLEAGAVQAKATIFFFGRNASPPRAVEPAAICLSRYKLDALMAERFRGSGGELCENTPFRSSLNEGFVRASGRHVQPIENGWRWFGLKAHVRNVNLSADLEMHCLANQYVGLGRIEDGKVNVCGLFRRQVSDSEPPRTRKELFCGPPGSTLHERLLHADFDEGSFCSVAGLPLKPRVACGRSECLVGDALTMIPPATGNGMSMAFESAAAAVEPLVAYSRGGLSWEAARQTVARKCDTIFARRLRWGSWLQHILFLPCVQGGMGRPVLGSEFLWKLLFARTR